MICHFSAGDRTGLKAGNMGKIHICFPWWQHVANFSIAVVIHTMGSDPKKAYLVSNWLVCTCRPFTLHLRGITRTWMTNGHDASPQQRGCGFSLMTVRIDFLFFGTEPHSFLKTSMDLSKHRTHFHCLSVHLIRAPDKITCSLHNRASGCICIVDTRSEHCCSNTV